MTILLETDRLELRRLTFDDAPDLEAILGDPETMVHYPRPYTPLEVERWILKNLERYRTLGFGLWALIHKDDRAFVGQCGLVPQRVEGTDEVEIGWHVNRAYWRQGYATEAAAAVRDYAFEEYGMSRLVSIVLPANVPSQGVARRIGMIPDRVVLHGGRAHLLFACSRDETADEVGRTRATYDEIAESYVAEWEKKTEVARRARTLFAQRLHPGAVVADIGCGPGRDLTLLRADGLTVIGIDLSEMMLRRAAAHGAPLVVADMRRLPVRDGALHGAWASASLLHIPRRTAPGVLQGLRRALRPEGVVFVSVKRGTGELWRIRSGHPRFFAFYEPDELDAVLEQTGFSVFDSWEEKDVLGREPWLNRLASAPRA